MAKSTSTRTALNTTRWRGSGIFDVHHGDARRLAPRLPSASIDVTITSPPYFDLKDYGVPNQIGFGQNYDSYLDDLQAIFAQVRRATKPHGSLWIVIDTFRRDQEVLPLPFDLASRLKRAGWVLRDVIIWKKERTVPWVHKGSTRKIFEYILVFSKTKAAYRHFPDSERDIHDLKRWWVRWPERYNPRGKAMEEIWSYDIPTQGSWGKKYIRHFCPLPAALVARIINFTTQPGDTVLDPFAGSGAVPTQALLLQRKAIGFELNRSYIAKFRKHLKAELRTRTRSKGTGDAMTVESFEKLIINLRILKFARLIFRALAKVVGRKHVSRVLVRPVKKDTLPKHKICGAELVVVTTVPRRSRIEKLLHKITAVPPLSKFGIDVEFKVVTSTVAIPRTYRSKRVYMYSTTASHQFAFEGAFASALKQPYPVISPLRVKVQVPDG